MYIFHWYFLFFHYSVGSNGIAKKKNKKKKQVAQKLSSNQELKEAAVAPSDLVKMSASPKNIKKKKNKKKNNNSQKLLDSAQKTDTNPQKSSEVEASVKSNGVQKVSKDESTAVVDSKKAEKTGKKTKKRTKSGLAKEKLSLTPETSEALERRTIFVGNVSTKTTRKSLTRFFSKYGKVIIWCEIIATENCLMDP